MKKGMFMALLAGLASALMLLAALALPGGLLFIFVASLPLFLAGLSMGLGAALAAGAVASAAMGFLGGIPTAVGILTTFAAPVAILVRQALLNRPAPDGGLEWYPPGLLATWLAGIGVGLLAFSAVALSGGEGIEATMRAEMARAFALLLPGAGEETLSQMASSIGNFGLGLSLDSWLLLLAANGVLAQGVLSRFGRNLRPAPDIAATSLPNWLPLALAAAALAAFFGAGDLAFLSFSLILILSLPFFFAGLGLIHAACRRAKARRAILIIFYVLLVLFHWPAVLIAALGLIDHWANFRGRPWAAGGEREDD